MSTEAERIRERYARRTRTYDPWVPWVARTRQELERAVIAALGQARMLPPSGRRLLDVGCGTGGHLLMFLRLGFAPESLAGSELQEDRARAARRRLPAAIPVYVGDAARLELPTESFDIVFQSLVFSSVLEDGMQLELADRMWRLVRPGGGVLWYDFTWDNPGNHDVRGVTLARVRRLFPAGRLVSRRVTLAPPLSRFVTAIHPALYNWCNALPLLRTHVLCWIAKPG